VLKTWSLLVASQSYKLELGRWIPALRQALARLEDGSVLVVKGALQLALALVNCSPWALTGAKGLDLAKLQGALQAQQGRLQVRGLGFLGGG
jgi:hypothetical protein